MMKSFLSKLQNYNYTGKSEEEDRGNKDTDKDCNESDDEVTIQLEDIDLACCAFIWLTMLWQNCDDYSLSVKLSSQAKY